MSRGIFSLNESYNEQISGDWSTASDVWAIGSPVIVAESPFGCCISGCNPDCTSPVSTVQRINYNDETFGVDTHFFNKNHINFFEPRDS